jgi:Flp pilus assembly protein TadG
VNSTGIRRDHQGATAVEFGITAPIFCLVLFGIIDGGFLLWTQLGMQHGADMAARCAAINKNTCGSNSATQTYAAQEAYGLSLPASVFTVSTSACGTLVTGTYTFNLITTYFGTPSITLNAQSCFPS